MSDAAKLLLAVSDQRWTTDFVLTRQYGTSGKVARANIQDPNSSSVEKCRQEKSEAMGGLFIALTNANFMSSRTE